MPCDYRGYPANWRKLVATARERSGDRCEWCGVENGGRHPLTGARVVLTLAHLDHNPESDDLSRMAYLCQRDHNRHDAPFRAANRRKTLAARLHAGVGSLFEEEP